MSRARPWRHVKVCVQEHHFISQQWSLLTFPKVTIILRVILLTEATVPFIMPLILPSTAILVCGMCYLQWQQAIVTCYKNATVIGLQFLFRPKTSIQTRRCCTQLLFSVCFTLSNVSFGTIWAVLCLSTVKWQKTRQDAFQIVLVQSSRNFLFEMWRF